ncbi:hypothetical protein GCM10009789_49880 [Kribbella sancticallisti]|uniref:Uncharacterized protein n=1 Tax=Kribbella sancticallisti TaxID=460087 RepID=A0ABN2E120_9ACTN
MQFVGLPSTAVYVVALVAWAACALATLYPRAEDLLAWKVFGLRPPNALESQQLGPAWFVVCAAAGVDPNRYRV